MIIAFQVGVIKVIYKYNWCYKLYIDKHRDCLSPPDVKNALDNIYKDFVVVPIDKATGNISVICTRSYASVITRELGLNNNSSRDT